jgi:hypothetical protein
LDAPPSSRPAVHTVTVPQSSGRDMFPRRTRLGAGIDGRRVTDRPWRVAAIGTARREPVETDAEPPSSAIGAAASAISTLRRAIIASIKPVDEALRPAGT